MVDLNVIRSVATRTAAKSLFLVKKYSPEILTGVGVVGTVASTFMACKATTKLEEHVDNLRNDIEDVNAIYDEGKLSNESYSRQDHMRDLGYVYVKHAKRFAALYGPSVTLGLASIGCILGAHGILRKRNAALVAAYKSLETTFSNYRKRVVEELGEDQERDIRLGIREEEIVEEDGSKKIVHKFDSNQPSLYARFFDELNQNWVKNPEHNLTYLLSQQNYANDKLHARGHLFLNEVYDMLGMQRSEAGQVVGWVSNGDGDGFVDFGIYNPYSTEAREFVNLNERSILLDFNVDGTILDKI